MFYERKGDEIITNAVDVLWNNLTFVIEKSGTLADGSCTWVNAELNCVNERWNKKILSAIVKKYNCELSGKEIKCQIRYDNLERAVMKIIQAVTAVETYLYLLSELED